jgi:hypothetical protein
LHLIFLDENFIHFWHFWSWFAINLMDFVLFENVLIKICTPKFEFLFLIYPVSARRGKKLQSKKRTIKNLRDNERQQWQILTNKDNWEKNSEISVLFCLLFFDICHYLSLLSFCIFDVFQFGSTFRPRLPL